MSSLFLKVVSQVSNQYKVLSSSIFNFCKNLKILFKLKQKRWNNCKSLNIYNSELFIYKKYKH